jgi:hypothetical protein
MHGLNKTAIKSILDTRLISCFIVFLLLLSYFYNRSFFIDEAALGLNINTKSYSDLAKSLSNNQSAPILFLWISKTVNNILPSDLLLRFFPLACSLLTILFLYKISILTEIRAIVKDEKHFIFLFTSLLFCTIFYRYSTEFKQYSTELFTTVFLYWLLLQNKYSAAYLWLILSIATTSISPILFVMCSASLVFDFNKINKKDYWVLCFLIGLYLLLFFLNLKIFFSNNSVRTYMLEFWHFAFLPKDILSKNFFIWMLQRFSVINYNLIFYNFYNLVRIKYLLMPLPFFLIIFQLLGVYKLIKIKQWKILILLTLPILTHLGVSYFKLNPFDTRLLFYLLINILILTLIGVINTRFHIIKYLVVSSMFLSFILNFPYQKEEVRNNLNYINKNISPGDIIYCFQDIKVVFDYYFYDKLINLKINSNDVIFGQYNIKKLDKIDRDLLLLNDKKGFLLFGNANPLVSRVSPFDFNLETFSGKNFIKTDETIFINRMKEVFEIKKVASYPGTNLYRFQSKINER